MPTPIWPIEGVALDSTGDEVAGSLGVVVKALQTTQTAETADITAIKAVTDVVPDAGAMTSIAQESTLKDVEAEVEETERHLHNYERWIGPAASPDGENHVADPLGEVGGTPAGVVTSFTVTSGANKTWGTAVQIFGATDAAVVLPTGRQAAFDLHRLNPTGTNEDKNSWLLRIICGTSAAAGVSADTYGTVPLFIENTNKVQIPVELITEKHAAGIKMWVQLLHVDNNNSKTVDLQFGIHGYPE